MIVFPAIKAKMGTWDYFMVKMTMRELSESVKFASDVYEEKTLDEAIQRVLDESRVKKSISTYLIRQPDRFFSSIVVAALGGSPNWFPVTMEDDPRFSLFIGDNRLNDSFGVLTFDGTQNYYALDGQHRLSAIKTLVDPNSDMANQAPPNFKNEEISVIVVVPKSAEDMDDFMKRYRRLFGNLNRYAKPMDQVTNIIMDEDDPFAIITRQLISEHEFFKWTGKHRESPRIKTTKGKNLSSKDPYFTSLEALYVLNIQILSSTIRKTNGWDDDGTAEESFKRFRPIEEIIDSLYKELVLYWDALIKTLPALKGEPIKMRDHNATEDSNTFDNILFWPIGQEILIDVARRLLDLQPDPQNPTEKSVMKALKPLVLVEWNFKKVPWRHLLLIPEFTDWSIWKIRNEERKPAQSLAKRIVMWQIGVDELSKEEISELKDEWAATILPAIDDEVKEGLWEEIENGVKR